MYGICGLRRPISIEVLSETLAALCGGSDTLPECDLPQNVVCHRMRSVTEYDLPKNVVCHTLWQEDTAEVMADMQLA